MKSILEYTNQGSEMKDVIAKIYTEVEKYMTVLSDLEQKVNDYIKTILNSKTPFKSKHSNFSDTMKYIDQVYFYIYSVIKFANSRSKYNDAMYGLRQIKGALDNANKKFGELDNTY